MQKGKQLKDNVKRFIEQHARKGKPTAPHLLAPTIVKRFKISLKLACKLAKAWSIYKL